MRFTIPKRACYENGTRTEKMGGTGHYVRVQCTRTRVLQRTVCWLRCDYRALLQLKVRRDTCERGKKSTVMAKIQPLKLSDLRSGEDYPVMGTQEQERRCLFHVKLTDFSMRSIESLINSEKVSRYATVLQFNAVGYFRALIDVLYLGNWYSPNTYVNTQSVHACLYTRVVYLFLSGCILFAVVWRWRWGKSSPINTCTHVHTHTTHTTPPVHVYIHSCSMWLFSPPQTQTCVVLFTFISVLRGVYIT